MVWPRYVGAAACGTTSRPVAVVRGTTPLRAVWAAHNRAGTVRRRQACPGTAAVHTQRGRRTGKRPRWRPRTKTRDRRQTVGRARRSCIPHRRPRPGNRQRCRGPRLTRR